MLLTLSDNNYIRAINYLISYIRENKSNDKYRLAFKSMRMTHME